MTTIRQLEPGDDLSDLIALSRVFFAEYAAHHAELFAVGDLRDSHIAAFFASSVDSDDRRTFVALAHGRIVGYITVGVRAQDPFYQVSRIGVISGLMIHQAHRRQGIAGQILARATAFFAEKEVKYFTVYTAVANQAALQFYQRHGMAPLHMTMVGTTEGDP